MGTLLYADDTIAQNELNQWWKNHLTLTSKDFKEHLRNKYPDYEWTQLYVSRLLYMANLPYTDNGTFRTYHNPNTVITSTNSSGTPVYIQINNGSLEDAFENALVTIETTGTLVSKKALKNQLKIQGWIYDIDYTADEFDTVFDNSDLDWTGAYNSENHKLYVRRTPGKHFSQTKGTLVDIKQMHPKHIYNTLKKKYSGFELEDCFDKNHEVYQLLEAYFTYNLREKISKLVE